MSSSESNIGFYREIYQYIKARSTYLRVVGNPGAVPAAAYANVVDAMVSFEHTASNFQNVDPRTNTPWLYTLSNNRQAMRVHNADTCAGMQTAVQSAASARYNHGIVYGTQPPYNPSTYVGNPWASLPSYRAGLMGTVQSVNADSPLTGC